MAHKELNKFSEHTFQKATGLMLLYINCPFIAADDLHDPLACNYYEHCSGHCMCSLMISVQLRVIFLWKAVKVVEIILGDSQVKVSQLTCSPSCLLTGSG